MVFFSSSFHPSDLDGLVVVYSLSPYISICLSIYPSFFYPSFYLSRSLPLYISFSYFFLNFCLSLFTSLAFSLSLYSLFPVLFSLSLSQPLALYLIILLNFIYYPCIYLNSQLSSFSLVKFQALGSYCFSPRHPTSHPPSPPSSFPIPSPFPLSQFSSPSH